MYDQKYEAVRDFFYTCQAISFVLMLFFLTFLLMTKEKSITYMAITLFPSETVGFYEKTVEVSEYRTDIYFTYKDVNGAVYSYRNHEYDFKDSKAIPLLYSEKFPSISYPLEKIQKIKSDFHIFAINFSFLLIFLIAIVFFGWKIYKHNNS